MSRIQEFCPRGGLPQCMLAYTPPGQTPPQADTPLGRHRPADGYCCRWYASYWNAFLFQKRLSVILSTGEDGLHPGGWGFNQGGVGWVCIQREGSASRWGLPPSTDLTSSGGHCSGRYAPYWNAFLLLFSIVAMVTV